VKSAREGAVQPAVLPAAGTFAFRLNAPLTLNVPVPVTVDPVSPPDAMKQAQDGRVRQRAQPSSLSIRPVQDFLDLWVLQLLVGDRNAVAMFASSDSGRRKLAEAFPQSSSHKLTVQDCRFRRTAPKHALAHCQVETHLVTRGGDVFNRVDAFTFRLEPHRDEWVVSQVDVKPR
jgi:hypothetical protein